jgi:deoxyribodipyrimidine photo-lyase
MVPADRIATANQQPIRDGGFVLYWMIAHRRPAWNHALDHAIAQAQALGRPLVVCEYLRSGHAFSCDRLHALMLDGMRDNRAAFAPSAVHYVPFVEERSGDGAAWLRRLVADASLVVTDTFPCYVHPRMVANLAAEAPCRVEAVDANGLLPLAAGERRERAVDFRRLLQRTLAPHLGRFPQAEPLRHLRLPRLDAARLPAGTDLDRLDPARLPIDHAVARVALRGGHRAGRARLATFLDERLARYGERNDPAADSASGLSPYLHLGHLSAHEVVQAVWDRAGWTPDRLGTGARGAKDGWWGVDPASEGFLDELVTWRELGYHYCHRQPAYADFTTLPPWALATLDAHRPDPRPWRYTRDQFESAATHDPIWNAAQRQLRGTGVIHNYLRMLWGKKVIEWSATPEEAWATLDHLNNRWAIDGCNPNSWTGIAWCFGRFDRPWAPNRPIFGSVRWMSSDQTRRKLDLTAYLARWG